MRFALCASLTLILLLALPGCSKTFGGPKPVLQVPTAAVAAAPLPQVPDEFRACFAGTTVLPAGAWSAEVTGDVLAKVRSSELSKTSCGQRFLLWYEDVRTGRKGL